MRFEPCLCGAPDCLECYPGVTEEQLEELRIIDNTPVPIRVRIANDESEEDNSND